MDKIDEVLTRGVEKIYPSRQELEKLLRSGKKIRVYQGFDPSMPNLHLGHFVGLLKLKQFQNLGHEIIFLVGDFTGMIGDPTGKLSARKQLTRKQVLANCKNWQQQAGKILNFKGKNPVKIMFNSQWLDKVSFKDLIKIASCFTVQQMIERDFFQKRIKEKKLIFLHEFLYPVAQAIDSTEMNVDLEIGGTDQMFNMLVGRNLMRKLLKKEKFVLTTKLLVDSQGQKVGKTAGNALFLNTSAENMYGGIMSFPDEVIPLAFELLTQVPLPASGRVKPMDLKKQLAFEIVKMYHSELAAQKAQKEFEQVFQKRKLPKQIPATPKAIAPGTYPVSKLVAASGATTSMAEAKRLIKQGGLDFEGKTVQNPQQEISVKGGEILKIGKKRFIKIKIK